MIELCKYFGECGGCSLQNIPYETQLNNKKELITKLLNITNTKDINIFSSSSLEYRNRMDFVFNDIGIGFRQKNKWHKFVDIEKCNISNKKLNDLLAEVRTHFAKEDNFNFKSKTGTYKYALIRTPGKDSLISFVVNKNSQNLQQAIQKIKDFAKITSANNILITYVPLQSDISFSSDYEIIKGSDTLTEEILGYQFKFSAQGFFQNNSKIANMIQDYVQKLLINYITQDEYKSKNYSLLDLYGGVGTFGIINSKLFSRTYIVEIDPNCIASAKENILLNNCKNVNVINIDAKNISAIEALLTLGPLFVITDPPRAGMSDETLFYINRVLPKVIMYVSCNPVSLAKDLLKLSEYTIKSVAVFDIFPQTEHIETIVELIKK
jgi:23S rRNA (uracil-5-)-methyltransferase RumA